MMQMLLLGCVRGLPMQFEREPISNFKIFLEITDHCCTESDIEKTKLGMLSLPTCDGNKIVVMDFVLQTS
jgi:hypothetical protein